MSRKSQIRKRERQKERFERSKLEQADCPPLKLPRIGFTGELIEHIQKRSLASIIAEFESEREEKQTT